METKFHLETRAVLAGAYKQRTIRSSLTHSCLVDDQGNVAQVVCQRVKPVHMCDPCATETVATPTCPRCYVRVVGRGRFV